MSVGGQINDQGITKVFLYIYYPIKLRHIFKCQITFHVYGLVLGHTKKPFEGVRSKGAKF